MTWHRCSNGPTVAYDDATGDPYCVVEDCADLRYPYRHVASACQSDAAIERDRNAQARGETCEQGTMTVTWRTS